MVKLYKYEREMCSKQFNHALSTGEFEEDEIWYCFLRDDIDTWKVNADLKGSFHIIVSDDMDIWGLVFFHPDRKTVAFLFDEFNIETDVKLDLIFLVQGNGMKLISQR